MKYLCSGYSSRRRGTCNGKSTIHPCNRLSCLSLAGHLRWEVDYPPSQPVGAGFEPHWRPQPAKLPSFGRYSLETLPYLAFSSADTALNTLNLILKAFGLEQGAASHPADPN